MTVRETGAPDGVPVREVRLTTPAGATASILNWGATVRDLTVPLRAGGTRRVVLGYEDPNAYRDNPCYLGGVVGRCCNRIADGRFTLDGVGHQLPINGDGNVHLHGGPRGFSRQPWQVVAATDTSVLLALTSPDGDQGYPGRVDVTCLYTLSDPATLRLEMTGRTDAPTVLNLTNHSYFTLAEGADAGDHRLQVHAGFYTPAHPTLIPTGEIRAVEGTPYDFRAARRVADGGIDYDINFVLDGPVGVTRPVARVLAPDHALALEVATDQPGLLFYSGSALFQAAPGLEGQAHGPRAGFCLESYRFTDSVNRPHFPSVVLRPGDTYTHTCEYRFTAP
ncbi:aldose epimerase family protein [Roseospira visakhapatnamensis]|uniref:Aldose 1-epimerase n=1 Tax=Roseospira visakhapatnamensis TaxID=390880 RepID=A0A7W6RD45_9PROT|nr:aldose epimerase family protein [Roseospira visakhapatnamensis]MBB4266381.1 aldose 1-epimerase [Roseospira visakhapatnamensis]